MKTFLITYQIHDTDHVITEEVEAADEACALGLVLDDLEDEDGEAVALDFVTIRRADVVMPLDALPPAILKAWRDGLKEEAPHG